MLQKKWIALLLLFLLMFGCAGKKPVPAAAPVETLVAPTPVVYAVGSSEGNDTLVVAAPTAPTSPTPVGKVEYRADEGARHEKLADGSLSVTGGHVEILIDGLAFSSPVVVSDGGSVRFLLTNGASLSGALTGETALDFSVTLDAQSAWSLQGDVRVDALVNGDAAFANVASNGHSIAYNCENAENAYLDRAALSLPGGGRLNPVI